MSKIERVCLGLLLSFPMPASAELGHAVQTEQALYAECSAYSQAGMKACLAQKADDSQRSLLSAENEALARLNRWDEDNKYIRAAKSRLAGSSKAFAAYRAAQCEFSASLSGGGAGNAHDMGRLACEAELNARRAAQLRNAVADLPLK